MVGARDRTAGGRGGTICWLPMGTYVMQAAWLLVVMGMGAKLGFAF